MDNFGNQEKKQNVALVIFAFLQADFEPYYNNELISLCNDIKTDWDISHNQNKIYAQDNGELESDGHQPVSVTVSLDDIQPQVDLQWLIGGGEEAFNYQAVAEELRAIAAQFEYRVVARSTQNLWMNISDSSSDVWKNHLADEVNRLMKQGMALEHLPQERVLVALTLTLVKGICIQAPKLLRSLFTTVHQLVCRAGAR